MSVNPKHILLVAPPLYGHAHSLLQLGLQLNQFHRITFAISESSFSVFEKELKDAPPGPHGPIQLIPVKQLPSEPLKTDEHSGDNPFPAEVRKLFLSFLPPMRDFFHAVPTGKYSEISDASVDLVIVDNFLGGPASILHQYGVPYYLFNSARGWLAQCFLTLDIDEPADFPAKNILPANFTRQSIGWKTTDGNLEANKDLLMDNCKTVHLAEGIIFNSTREIESSFLEAVSTFPKMTNKKLLFVGPLIGDSHPKSAVKPPAEEEIEKWLDGQKPASVLYVAFGSIAAPSPGDIREIGKAILSLKVPFIWSLKPEHYAYLSEEIQSSLNTGPDTSEKKPFLLVPWAPQQMILAHPATAAFLSHCGWNSTLESLFNGIPIVAWPMFADQLMNAEWLEEIGAGRVIRGTGILAKEVIPAEVIVGVLRELIERKDSAGKLSGKSARDAAQEWKRKLQKALATGGSSEMDLKRVIEI